MQASPMSDDLSALAWVYEEVRKTLDSAHKALYRCLKEAGASGFSDVDAIDPALLRTARQSIHQGVGALELAGLPAGAMLLRASEAVVQRFVARPQSIHEEGVRAVESASFALLDLMRRRLAGKQVSVLALFPQYEALMGLAGVELARPSDLWVQEWPAVSLEVPMAPPPGAQPRAVDKAAVAAFETSLLKLLRSHQPVDAQPLVDLCADLSADATSRQAHRESATWLLACGFLQGVAEGRLNLGVHVKRVLSSLLSQLRTLARGQGLPSERLAHELLFFCAQAGELDAVPSESSMLDRLRQAFRLSSHQPVDLVNPSLGRFDPAWVGQAVKRVAAAKDGWSAVAAGEVLRLGGLNEQFSLVGDSLRRLYPDGEVLASALSDTVAATVQSGQAPSAALAMEVATGLLYLEASLDESEFEHPQERERVQRLAQRIQAVRSGQEPEPLEGWMEALYRKVSDRQTIGSVVQELRATLGECEKHIDLFFRDHAQAVPLVEVPSRLQSMKGVLAVLGLDAAALAVARMRGDVESLLLPDADLAQAAQAGVHDRLASNLSALGFLVDMLAVQPSLAKSLFVFDDATGVLSPIMGRAAVAATDVDPVELMARPAEQVERVRTQEVVETLVESVTQDDLPLASLSEELQHLAETPLVLEQPDLAAKVADAQAAVERAATQPDDASQEQARGQVVAALNEFVQSVSEPIGLDLLPEAKPLAVSHELLQPTPAAAPTSTGLEEDDEMRGIFIEEAMEVLSEAREALASLQSRPDDVGLLTTLRRAFHTLKGSSRMVGLKDFGDGAWACEQLYNTWLATQAPASADLQGFTHEALDHLSLWVDDIVAKADQARTPQALIAAADALRLDGRRIAVAAPDVMVFDEPGEPTIEVVADQALMAPVSEPVSAPASAPAPAPGTLEHIVLDLSGGEPLTDEELLPRLEFSDTHPSGFSDTQPSGFFDTQPPDFSDTQTPDQAEFTELVIEPAPEDLGTVDLSSLSEAPLPALSAPDEPDLPALPEVTESDVPSEPVGVEIIEMPDMVEMGEAPVSTHDLVDESSDEQVKVIGSLRISIPLFNIYLNEADEQSRRLSQLLAEWSLEWHRPVGEDAVALAHSLAGNSGTVGYTDLSRLSRLLEHALMKSQSLGQGDEDTAVLFNDAAEEVRRLLHQFAAGFLKTPHEDLMARLEDFEREAAQRLEARSLGHDTGARAHLRLVRAEEAQPDDVLPDVALPDEVQPDEIQPDTPDEAETLAIPEVVEVAEPEPTPEALAAPASEEDDVASRPMPLGLPELRPFEPLSDLPRVSLKSSADEVDLGEDADIDAQDAIDADLFPIFEEEAQELLPQLSTDMREWVAEPTRRDLAVSCMRTLHTFKGGARLAGAMRLGELAHRMETAIERLSAQDEISLADVEPLQTRADILQEVFEALQRRDRDTQAAQVASVVAQDVEPLVLPADGADGLETLPLAEVPEDVSALSLTDIAAAAEIAAAPSMAIDWSVVRGDFRPGQALGAGDGSSGAGIAAVRVRPRLLDRLVNHAGEVSITRTRLASQMQQMRGSVSELSDNLERLRQHLRSIELQAETQLSTRMEAARAAQQEFDPLEFDRYTRLQELTRMMAESVNDVATVQRGMVRNLESAEDQLAAQSRLTRDLQDDLLRTRMVEFEGLSDRLYRVVRQAAKETGKQVRLDIVGGHTEVDRGVLDRMTGAFEHVLRNCVTHGIEAPADRQAAGKDTMGAIIIAVQHEGNEVSIEFRDDGAGLNLARIRAKAQTLGLLAPDAEPTDAELSQMIFTPGFSTAESVTELAGRGIGMDVVRSDVNAMGGRIETATAAGQGTSFKLVLPLTTAVTKVVMVRCGDLVASIPTNLVELVRRARPEEVLQAYAAGTVPFADLTLPFFWFGALLQHSPRGSVEGRSLPVVIVRSAQQRVALHVDEVLGNQDVVVKNLGPQLARVPGLAGMTLLASGAISLIYNPVALATVYGQEAQSWARRAAHLPADVQTVQVPTAADKPTAPLVLVVDDSLTVRRVTQRLLTREGYRVTLAKDGLDALAKMEEEIPLVVLSDIEMPRMDGFDLVRNLRGDARWRDIPIVMITSRIAQKHREYAAELGVNHYLGKPYSEEELLSLVSLYTHQAAQAQNEGT